MTVNCDEESLQKEMKSYFESRISSLEDRLKKIENLSKYAWEQVFKDPHEAADLFKMIYRQSRHSIECTCSCVGNKKITVPSNGCGETLCKAIEIEK